MAVLHVSVTLSILMLILKVLKILTSSIAGEDFFCFIISKSGLYAHKEAYVCDTIQSPVKSFTLNG